MKRCPCGKYAIYIEVLGLYRCFNCGRMYPAEEPEKEIEAE